MGAPVASLLQARALARGRARVRPRASRGDRSIPSVVVTGASSGIGAAVARRLLDRGWQVYASVRCAGEAPTGATELVFDVTDAGAIAAAAASVSSVDALVDNAGIAVAGPLEFLAPSELARQLDVNVVGQLRVTQAFLPALRRTGGRIVLMGSVAGRSSLPFLGAYAMSKFALEAMADALRVELEPWGIRVAIVEPGTIDTPIWSKPQRSTDDLPAEAIALYGARLARFRALAAARAESRAVPTAVVADAVEHALASPRPKTRYLVGPDARRRARLQRLPDRARDRLLARFLFRESRG